MLVKGHVTATSSLRCAVALAHDQLILPEHLFTENDSGRSFLVEVTFSFVLPRSPSCLVRSDEYPPHRSLQPELFSPTDPARFLAVSTKRCKALRLSCPVAVHKSMWRGIAAKNHQADQPLMDFSSHGKRLVRQRAVPSDDSLAFCALPGLQQRWLTTAAGLHSEAPVVAAEDSCRSREAQPLAAADGVVPLLTPLKHARGQYRTDRVHSPRFHLRCTLHWVPAQVPSRLLMTGRI